MISTLAGNLCAVESDLKHALKTVEQQGRFMADLSVRIDELTQRVGWIDQSLKNTDRTVIEHEHRLDAAGSHGVYR